MANGQGGHEGKGAMSAILYGQGTGAMRRRKGKGTEACGPCGTRPKGTWAMGGPVGVPGARSPRYAQEPQDLERAGDATPTWRWSAAGSPPPWRTIRPRADEQGPGDVRPGDVLPHEQCLQCNNKWPGSGRTHTPDQCAYRPLSDRGSGTPAAVTTVPSLPPTAEAPSTVAGCGVQCPSGQGTGAHERTTAAAGQVQPASPGGQERKPGAPMPPGTPGEVFYWTWEDLTPEGKCAATGLGFKKDKWPGGAAATEWHRKKYTSMSQQQKAHWAILGFASQEDWEKWKDPGEPARQGARSSAPSNRDRPPPSDSSSSATWHTPTHPLAPPSAHSARSLRGAREQWGSIGPAPTPQWQGWQVGGRTSTASRDGGRSHGLHQWGQAPQERGWVVPGGWR
jgi:hypothetical protein